MVANMPKHTDVKKTKDMVDKDNGGMLHWVLENTGFLGRAADALKEKKESSKKTAEEQAKEQEERRKQRQNR